MKIFLAGLIFFLVLSVSVISINNKQQLGRMSGLTEEYVDVAKNLLEYGMPYPDEDLIYLTRPPGYIFFLYHILKFPGHIPRLQQEHLAVIIQRYKMFDDWRFSPVFVFEERLIYFAQALLLCLSAVFMFLFFSRFSNARTAFLLAIAYGLNAYLIILNGVLHYQILHIFFVVLSTYFTIKGFEAHRHQRLRFIFSGLLWGMTTLIRPNTLILPLFLLAYAHLYFNGHWKKAISSLMAIVLGMAICILPTTIKNYQLTGRIIPVNVQAWNVLWASTVKQKNPDSNHMNWHNCWYPQGMAIYKDVTGEEYFYHLTVLKNSLKLDDAHKRAAFENIKKNPGIYLGNVMRNFWMFNVNINSIYVKFFQAIQDDSMPLDMRELTIPGTPQNFYSPFAQIIFEILHGMLLVLAVGGVYLALKNKEKAMLLWLTVYLVFMVGHSITYMDLMYYYIKMPFLYVFAGYCLILISKSGLRIGRLIFPPWLAVAVLSVILTIETGLLFIIL